MNPRIFTVDIDGVIITVVNNEIRGYVLEGNFLVDTFGVSEVFHQLLSGLGVTAYYAHLNLTKLFIKQLEEEEEAFEGGDPDYPQMAMDALQQHIAKHPMDWWMSDSACLKLEEVGAW